MVHYNEVGMDAYYGQNFFNCHSGTTYEVSFSIHFIHLSSEFLMHNNHVCFSGGGGIKSARAHIRGA